MAKSGLECVCGRHLMVSEDVCRKCEHPQTPAVAGLSVEQRLSLVESSVEINYKFAEGIAGAIIGRNRPSA